MLIARYFVEDMKCEVDLVDDYGCSALWMAALLGDSLAVTYLLEKGADKDKATTDGKTPVYVASEYGSLEVIKILRKNGADMLKTTINTNSSPLCIAIEKGHLEIVMYLLSVCGIDVNTTPGLLSPLIIAAASGNLDMVECLLTFHADMVKVRFDGATPLFVAAENGHSAVVDHLVKKDINIHKANQNGVTPLDIAIQKGHTEVSRLLNDHINKQEVARVADAVAEAVAVPVSSSEEETTEPFSKLLRR